MDLLTEDAKIIAGTMLAYMPVNTGKLCFRCQEARPTERTVAALDNLTACGYLRTNHPGGKNPTLEWVVIKSCMDFRTKYNKKLAKDFTLTEDI